MQSYYWNLPPASENVLVSTYMYLPPPPSFTPQPHSHSPLPGVGVIDHVMPENPPCPPSRKPVYRHCLQLLKNITSLSGVRRILSSRPRQMVGRAFVRRARVFWKIAALICSCSSPFCLPSIPLDHSQGSVPVGGLTTDVNRYTLTNHHKLQHLCILRGPVKSAEKTCTLSNIWFYLHNTNASTWQCILCKWIADHLSSILAVCF